MKAKSYEDMISEKLYGAKYKNLTPDLTFIVNKFMASTNGMEPSQIDECISMLKDPIWKESDRYYIEISTTGLARNSVTKEILQPRINKQNGYLYVSAKIKESDKWEPVAIHRLVGELFVDNPDPVKRTELHHINLDKTCNWPWNLIWLNPAIHKMIHHQDGTYPVAESISKYTEKQIRYVCQLLCDHPDWTYKRISDESGVSINAIGHIYRLERWRSVSKDYLPFPERHNRRDQYGSNNSMVKYTADDAERVCCLLDYMYTGKTNMSLNDIAKECGVSVSFVKHIWRGECWVNISSKHIFYKSKYGV